MNEPTLATVANMRQFKALHPGREIPGGGRVEGHRCFAFSPTTGEEASASSGDYFMLGMDEPLTGSDGEPMLLVTATTSYADAFTGDLV